MARALRNTHVGLLCVPFEAVKGYRGPILYLFDREKDINSGMGSPYGGSFLFPTDSSVGKTSRSIFSPRQFFGEGFLLGSLGCFLL